MADSTSAPGRHGGVVLITRNFPPLWGGMERLNWNLAGQLAQRGPVHVVAPRGAQRDAPAGAAVHEVALRPLWRFLLEAGWRGAGVAARTRPAWVLAGSGLTAPLAWLAARVGGARSAAYVHGLDVAVRHPLYRALWIPMLRRMDCVIANSRATAELARQVGVAQARLHVVHPGVEPVPPHDHSRARARFRERHGLGDAAVLLSVGRLTERKGLREFVADVLPRIAAQRADVRLVVVGDVPGAALHAKGQSVQSIVQAARDAGVEDKLCMLGTRFGEELDDAYAGADLHVFPVRELPGDPEGFGMVAIEAAAHGLATVAYASAGVVDAVADGVSGNLVPVADAAGFAAAVRARLREPLPRERVRGFAAEFAWDRFGRSVMRALGGHDDD